MTYSPTVGECQAWLLEHCENLLQEEEHPDLSITLDSLRIFLNAVEAPTAIQHTWLTKLKRLEHSQVTWRAKVQDIQALCSMCQPWLESPTYLQLSSKSYKTETCRVIPRCSADDYAATWPEGWNQQTTWFRQFFVGHPYLTVISPTSIDDPKTCLISVVKEDLHHGPQFRLIIRQPHETLRYLLPLATIQDTLQRLYAKTPNQADDPHHQDLHRFLLELNNPSSHPQPSADASHSRPPSLPTKKRQPLRSLSAALLPNQTAHSPGTSYSSMISCQHYRLLYAAIHAVYTRLDLRQCMSLMAETTIMSGLEKELIRFDEMVTPKTYKFGVLSVRDDQQCEEQWFGNTGLTKEMTRFLEILGTKVELRDYKQYAAGLDTKSGESGTHSYATHWKEHQIMFHVGPLMPFQPQDKQQVHRKRYIGNDIVCIVFMDTDRQALFNPNAIRSQFLHVFIVVHPEKVDGEPAWRVQIIHHQNVPDFGPSIPSPPVFVDPDQLREFLLLKLINAELAALKSDKFAGPNEKARQSMLRQLMDTGWKASNLVHQASSPSSSSSRSSFLLKTKMSNGEISLPSWLSHHAKLQAQKPPRPKSAGPADRASATSSRPHLHQHPLANRQLHLASSSSSSTSLLARSAPLQEPFLSSSLAMAGPRTSMLNQTPPSSHRLRDWKKLGRRHSTATPSSSPTLASEHTSRRRVHRTNQPPLLEHSLPSPSLDQTEAYQDDDDNPSSISSHSPIDTTLSLPHRSPHKPSSMESLPASPALSAYHSSARQQSSSPSQATSSAISFDEDLPPPPISSCSSSTVISHMTIATPSPPPLSTGPLLMDLPTPALSSHPTSLRSRAQLLMSSVIRRKQDLKTLSTKP